MSAVSRRQLRTTSSWWHSLIFVTAVILVVVTVIVDPRSRGSSSSSGAITYRVVDAASGQALAGVSVTVGGQTLLTGENGEVRMPVANVDQDMVIRLTGFNPVMGTAGPNSPKRQQIGLSIAPTQTPTEVVPTATIEPTATSTFAPLASGAPFTGTIVGADGETVYGAMVRIGRKWVLADDTGNFTFDDPGIATTAMVSASGYADAQIPVGANVHVVLDRFMVKGVYLNGTAAGYEDVVDNVIDLIDRTELNAVVVDIKDGSVFYDSQIEFFRKADAVRPTYDAVALLKKFHDHGIYVIARQVAFKDPLVARAYPELAVKDEKTKELWTGWAGEPWVNPLRNGLYRPNAELAEEAGNLGFDEIQYDYIRFPDGDLSGADFGSDYNDVEKRIGALTTILTMTHEKLRPLGVKLSADVFGWMLLVDDDQGIGQRFPDIAAVVDYISPMVYPSHFPTGSLAIDGMPNDHPYETIDISIGLGMQKIPEMELKMRPWLQDFTLPNELEYGATEIRAEIQAAEDNGCSGWMMWNVDASYVDDAYKAESP